MKQSIIIFYLFLLAAGLYAEDGSRLWLRYEKLPDDLAVKYSNQLSSCILLDPTTTGKLALRELQNAYEQFFGEKIKISNSEKSADLVLKIDKQLKKNDAYQIQTIQKQNKKQIVIAAKSSVGLLYGTFHLLRLLQTQQSIDQLSISEAPSYDRRILNHWDNIDGTIERGYAGKSLWQWDELPDKISPRYEEYARANASIGINGTVLNNVNANPQFISPEYLVKIAKLADIFRPYGIKVYLSVNFSSPKALGGLPTSDPLDENVRKWWKDKVKEIYSFIPDFGGFLVKANSEGLPGPQDYGRTHADGANMLAEALEPYNGIVMWRAFVYNPDSGDRAKQAYDEFMPLDGKFNKNVIIQVKNGPVDFQPREPINPLFGAMQQTPLMIEFQITQEYLGFSKQLVFLAPLFKECFDTDTYAKTPSAIAGVANTGNDKNWCGHHFAQANWYAFGRLAWNYNLTSEQIADEWMKMTFTNNPDFLNPVREIMLDSREAAVSYMMPLGLHHLFAWEHHYGPEPWCDIPGARPDWMPSYYHRADSIGIGFDRTTTGSNAVSQYFPPLRDLYNNIETCPEKFLLWFHHASWNHRMKNGRILWDELCHKYQEGVDQVRDFQKKWDTIEPLIDPERFSDVQYKLKIQTRDAVWWKDACLLYFQTFSKRPIPFELERPVHDLEEMKQIKLP